MHDRPCELRAGLDRNSRVGRLPRLARSTRPLVRGDLILVKVILDPVLLALHPGHRRHPSHLCGARRDGEPGYAVGEHPVDLAAAMDCAREEELAFGGLNRSDVGLEGAGRTSLKYLLRLLPSAPAFSG